MRKLTPILLFPALRLTGYAFPKNYRHGITLWNRIVYSLVDTVGCNLLQYKFDTIKSQAIELMNEAPNTANEKTLMRVFWYVILPIAMLGVYQANKQLAK